MTAPSLPQNERLQDLLAARATDILSAAQQDEMESLMAREAQCDDIAFDRAAGVVELAFLDRHYQPLPEAMRLTLIDEGEKEVERRTQGSSIDSSVAGADQNRTYRFSNWQSAGWLAAAAMLVISVIAWWPSTNTTPKQSRERLLVSAGDVKTVQWNIPTDERFTAVTGDVVWSTQQQTGYMRLKGMPVNDPSKTQYQLWIVDPNRDKHPVDGGVFNIDRNGEVIIPINAKLNVSPAAFAITEEQPGGVVVSSGPLLVVAPVDS